MKANFTLTRLVTFRLADSLPREHLDDWLRASSSLKLRRKSHDTFLAANPPPWDDLTEACYHGPFSDKLDEHLDIDEDICDVGLTVNILPKLASGQRPNVIDLMKNKDMALVINTPSGKTPREDEVKIRTATMQNRIPIMTTLRGADAALKAIKSLQGSEVQVRALQEYHS